MNISDTNTPRHLLVHGSVNRQVGSIAVAHYHLLKAYLDRGNYLSIVLSDRACSNIDETIPFHTHDRVRILRYETRKPLTQLLRYLPVWARLAIIRLHSDLFDKKNIEHMVQSHTANPPYDAVVFLGNPGFFKLPGIPCISCPQSLPTIEWKALYDNTRDYSLKSRLGIIQLWKIYYWYRIWLDGRLLKSSDHIFVLCDWLKGLLEDRDSDCSVSVLKFPFDLSRFVHTEKLTGDNTPTILWLGRMVPRKRLDLFLDALRVLREQGVPFTASVIGNPSSFSDIQNQIDRAIEDQLINYQKSVPYSDVPSLLHNASVLVQPSEYEPLGSSVIEALAAQLRVVMGPTNGTVSKDAPNTFWFSEYTAESVAAAIQESLNRSVADVSPDDILNYLNKHFSIEACVQVFSDTLEDVLAAYHD